MSPFHKPSFGIAVGAGLAIATVWCYKNVGTDESPRTQNTMQVVNSVGSLELLAPYDKIQLSSIEEEDSTDAPGMDFEPEGISLNSETLKANSSNVQTDELVFNASPPDNFSSGEVEEPKKSEAELADPASVPASEEWKSEIVSPEPSADNANAQATPAKKQIPVVTNIRKSWTQSADQSGTESAPIAISSGSSFTKNRHFNTVKNQPEFQGLAEPTQKTSQVNSAEEMAELDSTPSQNHSLLPGDTARKPSQQPLNSISKAIDAGAEKKSLKDGISVLQSESNTDAKEESEQLQYQRILSSPIVFANPTKSEQDSASGQLSDAVTVRAVQHIEYGKTLARRGARASAKQEFMAALSMIAQDFDAQANTNKHSQSLRRGTVALREAEEFITNDSESQIGMDVSSLIESHQCGALTKDESIGLSPLQALQRYFGFAQMQIEQGVGKNVVSAEALYGLGRLYTLSDSTGIAEGKLDRARAMVYHRASLNCDATNHRSANELGVLLAEFGELQESVDLLKQSLIIRPTPATWENLAKVHSRLDQTELAQLAKIEYQRAQANQSSGMIRWLEQNQFNETAPPEVIIASNPKSNSEPTEGTKSNGNRNVEAKSERESLPDRVKSWF